MGIFPFFSQGLRIAVEKNGLCGCLILFFQGKSFLEIADGQPCVALGAENAAMKGIDKALVIVVVLLYDEFRLLYVGQGFVIVPA